MLGGVDGTKPETCAECGFDGSRWRRRDAASLFDALGYWWRLALGEASPDQSSAQDLNRRPSSGVWSALEYGLHSALVTAVNRAGIEMILAENSVILPEPPALGSAEGDGDAALVLDPAQVLADLEREGRAMAAVARQSDGSWTNVGSLRGVTLQAEALLLHAAHDASHHFLDVSRGLGVLGAGTPAGRGTVAQINTSGGGVPKRPVPSGEVTIGWDGVAGDVQADRKHHGRPFQAVSLWSVEVIAGLAEDGHPIAPGCAGENLTLAGVDWASLRPGTRVRAGTAVLEISYPAVPCHKQTGWFSDGDFNRISHERNPALVRWYAWVREPGEVHIGDVVTVQP
jgi:MOSC domain-containing protein YiiM